MCCTSLNTSIESELNNYQRKLSYSIYDIKFNYFDSEGDDSSLDKEERTKQIVRKV